MTPPQNEAQDLRTYLRSVWRWKFLVLGLLLVVPGLSYALEARKVPQYQSSALVQPRAVSIDPTLFASAPSGSDGIYTVARLVQTRTIASAAGKLLRPPEPGGGISGLISVSPDIETALLTISATSPDPRRAADVANAFAEAISANRAAQTVGQIDAAVGGLKRQLANLPPEPRSTRANPLPPDPQRTLIVSQIQKLRGLRSTQRPNQGIIESAIPSATPVGRNTRRALELGVVIALLLSVGTVAVAESSDRRIRSPDDLEQLTGLPLLSSIPASAFASTEGERGDEEAFQMLRGSLTYFNVERQLKSVVIASAGQEDGKTTVAIRLAFALARAGSRVILVDADVRQPRIAARLGLPTTDGLGSVLVRVRPLSQALISLPVRVPDAAGTSARGSLKLLAGGASAPNPAELLSSPALAPLLTELEGQADIVIVDSAAALVVSDTLPLLRIASGVVIVARLNRSTKAAVRRLQQVIASADGTVLGAVATGATVHGGYTYGYDYETSDRSRFSPRRRRPKVSNPPASRPTASGAEPRPAAVPVVGETLDS